MWLSAFGARGQLQEWQHDFEKLEPQHRHIPHLYGLYPGNQISQRQTPELFAVALRTLELRGDEATGWSIGWEINLWVRLEDNDHARLLIRNLLSPQRTYLNLLDAHPPFPNRQQLRRRGGHRRNVAAIAEQRKSSFARAPTGVAAGRRAGFARGGFEVGVFRAKW